MKKRGPVSSTSRKITQFALPSLRPGLINWKLPAIIDGAGGFLSGLIGGLIGNQGAIRSLYLLNYKLEKQELIVSAALIAVVIDLTRIPVYTYANYQYLTDNRLLLALVILASIAGTLIGSRILPQFLQNCSNGLFWSPFCCWVS